jgi:hypothetical protein
MLRPFPRTLAKQQKSRFFSVFWLDTPGIGLYNPRTFRQAVSFF